MTAPRKRAPRKAAASQKSQRDRLLGRGRPTAQLRILADAEALESAQKHLREVELRQRQIKVKNDPSSSAHKAAEKAIEKAREPVDACYETITLRALPTAGEVTWETLAAQHPPTAEQIKRAREKRDDAQRKGEDLPEWPQYAETFWAPVLAACAESDMTEEDWAVFLGGNVSDGEFTSIKLKLISLNETERIADPATPFDLTQILSSLSKSR